MELPEFLLARIAEDEERLVHDFDCDRFEVYNYGTRRGDCDCSATAQLLADCEAKRRIVELHRSWPVLVETPPRFENAPGDVNGMTYRLTQRIAWATQEEYRKRFGSEPPTAPILQLLALPYADHPDFREEWRP